MSDPRRPFDPTAPTELGVTVVPPDALVPAVQVGRDLGPFRIVGVLGRGGMGVVYLAEHVQLARKVALKVLAHEFTTDAEFRERFVREARAAAAVDHPNIVPVYDAGEADGLLYLAMKHIEGRDLRGIVADHGALPTDQAGTIVSGVASALDAAHDRGLVHRDVKPANVLMGGGQPYLSDFGLAKSRIVGQGITATNQMVGTFQYVAPEQIQGRRVDARTDVYGLGCLLYVILTGKDPFPSHDAAQSLYAHMAEPPPRASDTRSELPVEVDDVIARALAKRPDDRFESCGELAGEFAAALTGRGDDSVADGRVLILSDDPARGRRLRAPLQSTKVQLLAPHEIASAEVLVVAAGSAEAATRLLSGSPGSAKTLVIVPRTESPSDVAGADSVLHAPVSDLQLMAGVQQLLGRPILE